MVAACVSACVAPFHLFLFAYAVLGPLHYITEISWLHDRSYFAKRPSARRWWLILVAGTMLVLMFGYILNDLFHRPVPPKYEIAMVYLVLATASMVLYIRHALNATALVVAAVVAIALFSETRTFFLFAYFLVTIIHVLVFTAAFVLFGALKTRSRAALVSLAVLVSCSVSFFVFVPMPSAPVLVNGFKAPIFLGSEGYLRIQIPWETPVNQRISFVVENGISQPFESVKTENSVTIATNFLLASYDPSSPEHSFPALFHQDFSSLVTASHPASDGEFLHLYMTGLGPVSPAVSTGEPAPSREPLSRIVNPMTCQAFNSQAQVPVKFAGLAPGLTGVYQVDIQATAGFSHAIAVTCTIIDSSGTAYAASVQVP
jgi:uncharacterized protein (TIGR03437 family)